MLGSVASSRCINVGDEVELVVGKYAGLRGRVERIRPKSAPFAINIMVKINWIGIDKKIRSRISDRFSKWQRVGSWKLVKRG